MPKYIIERNIPGAGALDRQQLAAITQTSCNVLKGMGPQIQWIELRHGRQDLLRLYRSR